MSRFIYSAAIWMLLPFVFWRILRRCSFFSKQKHPYPWKEYFGRSNQNFKKNGIWIHTLSLGESRSVISFIETLLASDEGNKIGVPITITTTTVSGYEQIKKHFNNRVQHHLMPLDYPFAVKAFLQKVKPKMLIVVETEIWPNTLRFCQKCNVQLIYANARIKESSYLKYKRYATSLMRESLERFDAIFPQSLLDKKRLIDLGAHEKQIIHCGNLKFDIDVPKGLMEAAQDWRKTYVKNRFVWVAVSVHPIEATQVIQAHQTLMEEIPDALLLIAPRKKEIVKEIKLAISACCKAEYTSVKNLQLHGMDADNNILVIDSFGEMLFWNAVSDCAFIGGSLVPFGGHNLIEAAIMKKPIISGKHYHNLENLFIPAIEAGAVTIVEDHNALCEKLKVFEKNDLQRRQAEKNAFEFAKRNQGNMKRLFHYIQGIR